MRKIQEIRGWILRTVERGGRFGASVQLIGTTLLELRSNLTDSEIRDELEYMARKGYLRVEEVRAKGVGERVIAYIEPRGQDLLDGSIDPDPGILLE